jgi:hypothetical protein
MITAFSVVSIAQSVEPATQDSLTWYVYIGGKPDMTRVKAEKTVANNWGIKMDYFFGDCGSTYDYKDDEFADKNKPLFKFLEGKYGEDWQVEFDKQTDVEWKKNQK